MKTVLFLCTGNYFRSRFAEHLFNHLAEARGMAVRAESAGLAPACHTRNPGPISSHTQAALARLGILATTRLPCDATGAHFSRATLVIALKEEEHRPMLEDRFATWMPQVRYWHVHDIPLVTEEEALAQIEALVARLLDELAGSPPVSTLPSA